MSRRNYLGEIKKWDWEVGKMYWQFFLFVCEVKLFSSSSALWLTRVKNVIGVIKEGKKAQSKKTKALP